jgi:hypothetical protein
VHDGRLQIVTRDEYRQMAIRAAQSAPAPVAPGPGAQPQPGHTVQQQFSMLRAGSTAVPQAKTGEAS